MATQKPAVEDRHHTPSDAQSLPFAPQYRVNRKEYPSAGPSDRRKQEEVSNTVHDDHIACSCPSDIKPQPSRIAQLVQMKAQAVRIQCPGAAANDEAIVVGRLRLNRRKRSCTAPPCAFAKVEKLTRIGHSGLAFITLALTPAAIRTKDVTRNRSVVDWARIVRQLFPLSKERRAPGTAPRAAVGPFSIVFYVVAQIAWRWR